MPRHPEPAKPTAEPAKPTAKPTATATEPTPSGPVGRVAVFAEQGLYAVTIAVIVLGALQALGVWAVAAARREGSPPEQMDRARLQLSSSMTLGLTFFVGAEIVKTFRVPRWPQLVKVVLLILIRQLLTYFLDSDTARLKAQLQASAQQRDAERDAGRA